jgi:hypothetical protein
MHRFNAAISRCLHNKSSAGNKLAPPCLAKCRAPWVSLVAFHRQGFVVGAWPNWSFNADVHASHGRRLTLALGFLFLKAISCQGFGH